MPDPQPAPAPQQDYSIIIVLILAYLLFAGGTGGGTSPTKTIPSVPSVFTLFDDSPTAMIDLEKNHKGQYDVLESNADDAIQTWVLKDQKGVYLKYGTGEPVPEAKMAGDWAVEAYNIAKAAGKLPYTVASGPNRKGYSGPTPDGQADANTKLKVIGK